MNSFEQVNNQEDEIGYPDEEHLDDDEYILKADDFGNGEIGLYVRTEMSKPRFAEYIETGELDAEPNNFNDFEDLAELSVPEAKADNYDLLWVEDGDYARITLQGSPTKEALEMFIDYGPKETVREALEQVMEESPLDPPNNRIEN